MVRNPECGAEHTLDVFNQNLASAGAWVRLAHIIDSDDPEVVALQCPEAGHRELCGGVEAVWVVHTDPVRFALILDLNDVAFDGASSIPLWRLPGQRHAVFGLISNLRSCRHTGRSWSEEHKLVLKQLTIFLKCGFIWKAPLTY